MEGLCKNCGWHRMMEENVEMLCGEQSRDLNFIPLDDTSLRYVKTTTDAFSVCRYSGRSGQNR